MRVIVTGGGTGGHIYPALAIAQGLLAQNEGHKILYVGTRDGMEAKLVPEAGIEFAGISGQGLPRRLTVQTVKTLARNVKALWQTKQILKKFHPDLVVGTGGYVSGPVVLTSALFGIPTMLHEQNALPGITNKTLARFVRKVMVTFPESISHFGNKDNLAIVGLPLRQEIGTITREAGARHFGLRADRLTLLVTGGSRGAKRINEAMLTVLRRLPEHPEVQLIWATGSATYEETRSKISEAGIKLEDHEQWRILEYLDMPEALACADLCVGRAGAVSLAELMAAAKPGILIPYPYAAENHQEYNARALAEGGAARLILNSELDGERLWEEIEALLFQPALLDEMGKAARKMAQPEALAKIVDLCLATGWH